MAKQLNERIRELLDKHGEGLIYSQATEHMKGWPQKPSRKHFDNTKRLWKMGKAASPPAPAKTDAGVKVKKKFAAKVAAKKEPVGASPPAPASGKRPVTEAVAVARDLIARIGKADAVALIESL